MKNHVYVAACDKNGGIYHYTQNPDGSLEFIDVYPIGVRRMTDGGKLDDKIIAIAVSDPNYNKIKTIDELPTHIFDEIMHFFSVYKQLENKQTAVRELFGPDEARRIVAEAISGYNKDILPTLYRYH